MSSELFFYFSCSGHGCWWAVRVCAGLLPEPLRSPPHPVQRYRLTRTLYKTTKKEICRKWYSALSLCAAYLLVFGLLSLGSSEHVESVMDQVEKYMMTRLYKEVFCPETTDDEKKDLAIQKRIRLANNAYICNSKSNQYLCMSKKEHNCKNFSRGFLTL